MKYPLSLLFLVFIFSCEKEDNLHQCETDKTFTLRFTNYSGVASVLYAGGREYNVVQSPELDLNVKVSDAPTVAVRYKVEYKGWDSKTYYRDTVSYMQNTPQPCAVYFITY